MARGDSKKVAEYDFKSGGGSYNNSSDTFSWVLVTDAFGDIDEETALNLASFTQATIGGNYAGKTALTNVSWSRTGSVSTLTYDNISFSADASNPTDAKCIVIINDTSSSDDAFKITDITTDGSTAVDLTSGFTLNVNASGSATVTTNA